VIIFELIDRKGPVITVWLLEELEPKHRYLLEEKLDRITQADPEIAKTLISGTRARGIFKVKVKSNIQLRPLLCYGPLRPKEEVTFLFPAYERDDDWEPSGAPEMASARRDQLTAGKAERVKYERPAR